MRKHRCVCIGVPAVRWASVIHFVTCPFRIRSVELSRCLLWVLFMCFAAFGKLCDDVRWGYGAEGLSSERQNW